LSIEVHDVYGPWTVERPLEDGRYRCRCVCGRSVDVSVGSLSRVVLDECRCRKRSRRRKSRPDDGPVGRWLFERFRRNAERRRIAWALSYEDVVVLWEEQGGRCHYSGLGLEAARRGPGLTASLDRLDSDGDYTPGNVVWCHMDVNMMKQSYSPEKFVWLCHRVSERQKEVGNS